MIHPVIAVCLVAMSSITGEVFAQKPWTATGIDSAQLPAEIVPESRTPALDGLPDGLIATGDGTIARAWYTGPTTRYGHGILGDAIEAGGLKVETSAGDVHELKLPQDEVFEDRYPRLADLDGDGTTEVVTIHSSLTEGGSVTVYGVRGGSLSQLATTGFIGRANRWLNIAGIAAFAGGKARQIAYVSTPHIGGTLYLYQFDGHGLNKVAAQYGFSNHVIGAREMRLSALVDIDGDGIIDIAVPSDDRGTLRMMSLKNGKLKELATVPLQSRIDKAIAVTGSGASVTFTVGLSNGRVTRIHR